MPVSRAIGAIHHDAVATLVAVPTELVLEPAVLGRLGRRGRALVASVLMRPEAWSALATFCDAIAVIASEADSLSSDERARLLRDVA